jgi:hypothetical protein
LLNQTVTVTTVTGEEKLDEHTTKTPCNTNKEEEEKDNRKRSREENSST